MNNSLLRNKVTLLKDGLFVTELFKQMNTEQQNEFLSTGVVKYISTTKKSMPHVAKKTTKRRIKPIKRYLHLEYKPCQNRDRDKKYYAMKAGRNIEIKYEYNNERTFDN